MTAAHPHVAESDCERIRPGWIGQPANTVSSLAFAAAAVPIARRARAAHSRGWMAVAAAAAVEGAGSVAYHGPGGRAAKALHDAGLVALVAALVAAHGADRPSRPRPQAVVLGGAAAALHALSRTGGPLCSRDRLVQGHAAFHLLAAAALVAASPPAAAR